MPIVLVSGPANAGKARFLLDAFAVHLARGEDPLLVVPTRPDVDHYRRELATRGVMLGGRVERFSGLAEELARRAGLDGTPALGPLARERILASLARERPPGPFEGVRETPGFQRASGELVAELESRHLSPSRLRVLLGTAGEALEVCALYEAYRRALERIGRLDRELRTVAALDTLRREPARWGARPVLFYGFDDMTALELDTIETLGRVVQAPVTVTLAYEGGRAAFAGRARAFQRLLPLAEEHRELPASPAHYAPPPAPLGQLERSLFAPGCRPSPPSSGGGRGCDQAARRRRRAGRARARRGRDQGPARSGHGRGGDRARAPLPGTGRRADRGGSAGLRHTPCARATPGIRPHRPRAGADRRAAGRPRGRARAHPRAARCGCAGRGCWSAPSWPTSSRPRCTGAGSRAPPRRGPCGRPNARLSIRSSA